MELDLTNVKIEKVTNLEEEDSILGYFLQKIRNDRFPVDDVLFKCKETGEITRYLTAGSFKWYVFDGKLKEGFFYKITRVKDKKVKGGFMSSNFTIEVNEEDFLEDFVLNHTDEPS